MRNTLSKVFALLLAVCMMAVPVLASADGEPFSFNASVYTQEELERKRHNYELEPCGSTVLCLDHRMAGIGSKSCGPDLPEQYRVSADSFRFSFMLRPEEI